jgi:hypothetical protein
MQLMFRRLGALLLVVPLVLLGPVLPIPDSAAARPDTAIRSDRVQLSVGRADAAGPPDNAGRGHEHTPMTLDGHAVTDPGHAGSTGPSHDDHDDHDDHAHAENEHDDDIPLAEDELIAATPPMDTGDAVLIGATWDTDAAVEMRVSDDGQWTPWIRLYRDTHEHVPDPDSHELAGMNSYASEPVWTGPVDQVQFRATEAANLDITFVDSVGGSMAWTPNQARAGAAHASSNPTILTRKDWGANESLRDGRVDYSSSGSVRFTVLHHIGASSTWTQEEIAAGCRRADDMIRSIYTYHTRSLGYWDIAYNFIVDPCGRIWEGRAGGIDQPVNGAHAGGFNDGSAGILALGTFSGSAPDPVTPRMLDGIAQVVGYKLSLHAVEPSGTTREVSGGGTARWPKGTNVTLPVLSAHQISNSTLCPGWRLMQMLFSGDGSTARPLDSYVRDVRQYFNPGIALPAVCQPVDGQESASFSDVSPTGTFSTFIHCQANLGIARGFPDGTYRPTEGVTRGQMAQFVYNLVETGNPGLLDPDATHQFQDVPPGHRFGAAIAGLSAAGLVNGLNPTEYAPGDLVTRNQMAKFVVDALQAITGADLMGDHHNPFSDVPDDGYFTPYITALAHLGVVTGDGTGYGPTRPVTRGQMAAFTIGAAEIAHHMGAWTPTFEPEPEATDEPTEEPTDEPTEDPTGDPSTEAIEEPTGGGSTG